MELGDSWGQSQTTYPLAALAAITGDYARAQHLHRAGLELAEELGFRAATAERITGLGRIALLTGDFRQAADRTGRQWKALARHRQSLAVASESGDPRVIALAREGLAGAYSLMGRSTQAARLLGTATRARQSAGAPLPVAERGDVERITARIRTTLSDAEFDAEFATDADDPAQPGQ